MAVYWDSVRDETQLLTEQVRQRQQFANAAAGVTPDVAARAVQLTRLAPNASPGVVQAGITLGMSDEDFMQFAMQDDGQSSNGGHGWNLFGYAGDLLEGVVDLGLDAASGVYEQALKPLVRGAFTATQGLVEDGAFRPIIAAGTALRGEASFAEAYQRQGNSPLVNALVSTIRNPSDPLNLGTGFFAGGEAAQASEEQNTLLIEGQPSSFGGLVAHNTVGVFTNPGDQAYDITAGVAQLAGEVFLDPTTLVLGGGKWLGKAVARMGASDEAAQLLSHGLAGAARESRRLTPAMLSDEIRALAFHADGTLTDEAARAFGGLVNTRTGRSVLVDEAERLLQDPTLLRRLSESNTLDLLEAWDRSPSKTIPYEVLRTIGRSSDEEEIAGALLSAIGRNHIRERGIYTKWGVQRRSFTASRKYAGIAPNGSLDPEDIGSAILKVDSQLRQTGASREVRQEVLDSFLDLRTGDSAGMLDAYSNAAVRMGETVQGVDTTATRSAVRDMTRIWKDDLVGLNHYGTLEDGSDIASPYMRTLTTRGADGREFTVNLPGPQLTSEMSQLRIPLLDTKELRHASARWDWQRQVYQSMGWRTGTAFAQSLTRSVFKPAALLRPAYILRTGLDDQLRMTAAGMDSVLTNPWHFIQSYVKNPEATLDLFGTDLRRAREARHILNVEVTGSLGGLDRFRSNRWGLLAKGDITSGAEASESYISAVRVELGQLAAADESRWIARNYGDPDLLNNFVDWIRSEDGSRVLDRYARTNKATAALYQSDDAVRQWGQSILDRISDKTGGNSEILSLLNDLHPDISINNWTKDKDLHRILRNNLESLPAQVKAEAQANASLLRQQTSRFVNYLGDHIIVKPNTAFARYPTWRQAIHSDLVDLMPAMVDDALRSAVVEGAEAGMNLTPAQLEQLKDAASAARGSTGLVTSLQEVNDLSMMHATETVSQLLFDVSNKSAFQDVFDGIFPFIDAWHEGISVWSKLLKDHPEFFARSVASIRGADASGVLYTNDRGERVFTAPVSRALGGFVQNLSQTGFSGLGATAGAGVGALVGSRVGGGVGAAVGATAGGLLGGSAPAAALTTRDAVTGDLPDYRLTPEFRLSGVNLMVNGVGPGFGPMVQWAAGAFLPDTETFDGLREIINPYGSPFDAPSDLADLGNYIEGLAPSWARRVVNGVTSGDVNEVEWNTAVHDSLDALVVSGRYDPTDPDDLDRLTRDAERAARYTLFIKGLVQSSFLTSPSLTYQAKTDGPSDVEIPEGWEPEADPDGVWHSISSLASAYYDLTKVYGDPDLAHAKFIEMYGVEPAYLAQANTQSFGRLPASRSGDRWMQSNEDFVRRHPIVAGYFAPADQGEEFDYATWRRQVERGDREFLTPEQTIRLGNQARARQIYYTIKNRTERLPNSQRDELLRRVKANLEEQFPQWENPILGIDQVSNSDRIEALLEASSDPSLEKNPVAEAVQQYRVLRQIAWNQMNAATGLTTFNNKGSLPWREWLTQAGLNLLRNNPSFAGVWTVFQRELD